MSRGFQTALLFTIFLTWLTILPAFAQINNTGEENGKSPSKGEDEFSFERVAVSIAISVGGGTVLGYFLSTWRENSRRREELQKVRTLLIDDFNHINNHLLDTAIPNVTNKIASLNVAGSLANLIARRESPYDFLSGCKAYVDLVFWTTLVSSGLLIRLETADLRLIQSGRDAVVSTQEAIDESFDTMYKETSRVIDDPTLTDAQKETKIRDGLGRWLNAVLQEYNAFHNKLVQRLNAFQGMNLRP